MSREKFSLILLFLIVILACLSACRIGYYYGQKSWDFIEISDEKTVP